MGLLTRLIDLLPGDKVRYDYINQLKADLYDLLGTDINGRGSLTWENLAEDAEIAAEQIADTAAVLGGGVLQVFTNLVALAWGSYTNVGTGTADALVGGVIHANTTAVGNVGAGEDDLMSYTIPANTLIVTGRGIRVIAWGGLANNANAKTIRLRLGGNTILQSTLTASAARGWRLEAIILRTGLSAQDTMALIQDFTYAVLTAGAPVGEMLLSNQVLTETAAIILKVTGSATSNDDIVQEGMIVEAI